MKFCISKHPFLLIAFVNVSSLTTYLKFSSQTGEKLEEAKNFAGLKSGTMSVLPSKEFTICSSIYIGFFRGVGTQTFYTLRRNDQKTLWFSLFLHSQDLASQNYNVMVSVYGASVFSTNKVANRLTLEMLRIGTYFW